MKRPLLRRCGAFVTLVVAAALSVTTSAYAFHDSEKAVFGPVRVADGQILRSMCTASAIRTYSHGRSWCGSWTRRARS